MALASRRGFTLLELIAALSLTGFVLIGGILLLDQLGDSATRIGRDGARAARDGNGRRLLARLLLDATASTDSTKRLRGDEHSVEFSTECQVPGGWLEACRVTLTLDERVDSNAMLATFSTGESYTLRREPGTAELRFLNPASTGDTVWVRKWSSNVTLPAAVGLLVGNDTITYPISVARD